MDNLDGLMPLQREQREHDIKAHADILALTSHRRLVHMTLHFAKYVGLLSTELKEDELQRVIVDTMIIGLASANSLNVDLSARIPEQCKLSSLSQLQLGMGATCATVRTATLRALAVATGAMAKACESMDHMESYDARACLEREVVQIVCIALAAFRALGWDAPAQLRARWKNVERKSIFQLDNQDSRAEEHTATHRRVG